MIEGYSIIKQKAENATITHSVCLGFVKIKSGIQVVLFDYTLILPWKIQVTHRMAM